jgi:hypothetical protein
MKPVAVLMLVPPEEEQAEILSSVDGPPYNRAEFVERDCYTRKLADKYCGKTGLYIRADNGMRNAGGAVGFPEFPQFIKDILLVAASSGTTAFLFQLIRSWIDSKNGRRLRVRLGDLELEATQMKSDEFLSLLESIQGLQESNEIKKAIVRAGFDIEPKTGLIIRK